MSEFTAAISGHVQGVGFRYGTRRLAEQLGLARWVCNRSDGSLQVRAQGSADSLAQLSAFLEHGPFGATVTSAKRNDTEPDPTPTGFEIRGRGFG